MEKKKRLNRLQKQTSLSVPLPGTTSKKLLVPVSIEENYNGPKNAPKFSILPDKGMTQILGTGNGFWIIKYREEIICDSVFLETIQVGVRKGQQIRPRHSSERVLDPKDKAALASMQRQRATFTSQEDTFVSCFICLFLWWCIVNRINVRFRIGWAWLLGKMSPYVKLPSCISCFYWVFKRMSWLLIQVVQRLLQLSTRHH